MLSRKGNTMFTEQNRRKIMLGEGIATKDLRYEQSLRKVERIRVLPHEQ